MNSDWCQLVCSGLLLCGLAISGCGYPEVSPTSYELSKALYSACNRRSDEHLLQVIELADLKLAEGEISDRESMWLRTIVDQARAGDWESAQAEVRKMMEDQVNR